MLIIKNMDMPKNCNYCRFNYDGLCHAARKSLRESHAHIDGRLADCPLEPFSWLYENDKNEIAEGERMSISKRSPIAVFLAALVPCEKCGYPCQARENSSTANCERHMEELIKQGKVQIYVQWVEPKGV